MLVIEAALVVALFVAVLALVVHGVLEVTRAHRGPLTDRDVAHRTRPYGHVRPHDRDMWFDGTWSQ